MTNNNFWNRSVLYEMNVRQITAQGTCGQLRSVCLFYVPWVLTPCG